jgi:hypothetical protein
VAVLEGVKMVQDEKDRVIVSGIKGNPPPTTTKVGITASGGYQAEFHFYVVGLDLEQKLEWMKRQVCYELCSSKNPERTASGSFTVWARISCLKFTLNGYSQPDPENQDVATADIRVFCQTKDRSLVVKDSMEVPGFNRWVDENFFQSCPGGKY